MLAKRIIPCLDVKDKRVVKGIHFLNLRDAGDPVENATFYSQAGADEIVFLDITATIEKRKTILNIVAKTAEQVFIPLTVGGGIKNLEDIRMLLKSGADKVSINTSAVKNPDLIRQASETFGSQCIVVAIDAKKIQNDEIVASKTPHLSLRAKAKQSQRSEGLPRSLCSLAMTSWQVYINSGRTATNLDVLTWAKEVEKLGAGEILLTSMDRDGTKEGYDIPLLRIVSETVNIPVIASGGAGNPEHLYQAFAKGKADAVLAASIFHYGEFSLKETKEFLQKKGIEMRF